MSPELTEAPERNAQVSSRACAFKRVSWPSFERLYAALLSRCQARWPLRARQDPAWDERPQPQRGARCAVRQGSGFARARTKWTNGTFIFSFPNGSSLLFGADGARLPLARYPPPRAPSHQARLLQRSARMRGRVPSFASDAHQLRLARCPGPVFRKALPPGWETNPASSLR